MRGTLRSCEARTEGGVEASNVPHFLLSVVSALQSTRDGQECVVNGQTSERSFLTLCAPGMSAPVSARGLFGGDSSDEEDAAFENEVRCSAPAWKCTQSSFRSSRLLSGPGGTGGACRRQLARPGAPVPPAERQRRLARHVRAGRVGCRQRGAAARPPRAGAGQRHRRAGALLRAGPGPGRYDERRGRRRGGVGDRGHVCPQWPGTLYCAGRELRAV